MDKKPTNRVYRGASFVDKKSTLNFEKKSKIIFWEYNGASFIFVRSNLKHLVNHNLKPNTGKMSLVKITADFLSTKDAPRRSHTHVDFLSKNDAPRRPQNVSPLLIRESVHR